MQQTEQQRLNKDIDEFAKHLFCPRCYPDGRKALCGTDISEYEDAEPDTAEETTCIVCRDLNEQPCEFCGY